jgi:pimeloyl-ACP methyl ester carboxylesterase
MTMSTRVASPTAPQSESPIPDVRPLPDELGGVFPHSDARAALMALYDAKLAQWPVHHEEFDVRTSYGRTHVVAAGSPASPPLILLHMAACTSFIWEPVIAQLAARYRTYAIDTIGDVNKSVLDDPRRHPATGSALAEWLREVADALRIESSDVIGSSYGGWLAMHYAAAAPERVRRLAVIVPMGLPMWTQTLGVLFRLMTIQIGLSHAKRERTLSYLMGDDPATRHLAGDWIERMLAWKCRTRMPNPRPLSARQLQMIHAPTLVVLGGRDPLVGDAKRAARRARRYIPDVEVEIVPTGTHAALVESPGYVTWRILEFLTR